MAVIVCGLCLRRFGYDVGLPFVAVKYGGSVLWGAMIYLLLAAFFPSRWHGYEVHIAILTVVLVELVRLGADSRAWSTRVRAEMQEMLQEWFNSATQCEEADVDHEFNRALEHLMIFAERPQDLVAEDASYDLATLPRFDQFCQESETARLSGEGAFIRYEHAAQLVRALELKVAQADFNYDSDRAAWQRRCASVTCRWCTSSSSITRP